MSSLTDYHSQTCSEQVLWTSGINNASRFASHRELQDYEAEKNLGDADLELNNGEGDERQIFFDLELNIGSAWHLGVLILQCSWSSSLTVTFSQSCFVCRICYVPVHQCEL